MKITKRNLKLFDRIYCEIVRNLINDLTLYKLAYMKNLEDIDAKAIDVNSVQELSLLAKQAIMHRISLFDGKGGESGDSAVDEAQKIIDGK